MNNKPDKLTTISQLLKAVGSMMFFSGLVIIGIIILIAIFSSSAHGSVMYPINGCEQNAWTPLRIDNNTQVEARGDIDCSGVNKQLQIKGCVQVEGANGTWYTKTSTCVTYPVNGTTLASKLTITTDTNDAVVGHKYRSWIWVYVAGASQVNTSLGLVL